MKRTILLYFLTCLFFCSSTHAQIGGDSNSLTKRQMFEDFDLFFYKLDSINPNLEVVKKTTGYDILAELRNLRQKIDTVTNDMGFFDIMYRAMILCKDRHVSFTPTNTQDTLVAKLANNNLKKVMKIYNKYDERFNPFPIYYVDGKYYATDVFSLNSELLVPAKSQIIQINNLAVDEYIEKYVVPIYEQPRWDNKHKKYYVRTLFPPKRTGFSDKFIVTYLNNGKTEIKELSEYKINFPLNKGVFDPNVLYLSRDKILYIRVPVMNHEWIKDYKDNILKNKGKEIDKVVIDIRGNGGGSDFVWIGILSAIIDKPISSLERLAFKDNNLVKEYLKKNNITYTSEELDKEPLYIGKDKYFCIQAPRKIDPDENSLRYTGNIYVLTDFRCFSSALAFSAYCQNVERLITVGNPSGFLCGQGVTPFYFTFPNSKISFRIPNCLDATNVAPNDFYGYYHNFVEIPVDLSLEYLTTESAFEGLMFSEDYLYSIDPVFRKILDLQ